MELLRHMSKRYREYAYLASINYWVFMVLIHPEILLIPNRQNQVKRGPICYFFL